MMQLSLNPFTFFGLLGSRAVTVAETEPTPNGRPRTNGANSSGRATLLTAPQQAAIDAPYDALEDDATISLREEREAAQARMTSTSIQLNGSLDDLIAQQARDAEARE